MVKTKSAGVVKVGVRPLNIGLLKVHIVGDTPLICSRFSEKAKRQILEKQQKKASAQAKKPARDPEAEYEASFYKTANGEIGFPALGFKTSFVSAARNLEGVTMTLLNGAIFVVGDSEGMVKIDYKNRRMREDYVRLSGPGRTADLRYRGELTGWTADFVVKFNADLFSVDEVYNLMQTAGFACGIGEWRPERGGDFGQYKVEIGEK